MSARRGLIGARVSRDRSGGILAGYRFPRWLSLTILLVVAGLVLLPLIFLAASWLNIESEIWQHLRENLLVRLSINTLSLVALVAAGTLLIGTSLAWLVAMCEFPGRRWLEWALMMPLALPAYVLAFVLLGWFDFGGPVEQAIRSITGSNWLIPDIRNRFGVALALTLVLYPYVYLLTRAAFKRQGRAAFDTARTLGYSPMRTFFRLSLPMTRPAIVAGLALVVMETLADFGAVAIFNYDTFTTAIYKSWFGFFSINAAAQLATLLMLLVAVALLSERKLRGHAEYRQTGSGHFDWRIQLSGWRKHLASAGCFAVVLMGFILPCLQLLVWVAAEFAMLDSQFWQLLTNTLTLAALAGGATFLIASLLLLAGSNGKRRAAMPLLEFTQLGYAVPGTVLAVGILLSFNSLINNLLDPALVWLGFGPSSLLASGVPVLILAYVIRFLRVAYGPLESGLAQITPSLVESARTLGASRRDLTTRILLPLLKPSVLTALVLVFVDVMKEMPATLLLRPFGWDTLAVRIYELTSEGEWQAAAIPALFLVLAGLIPVILLVGQDRQKSR